VTKEQRAVLDILLNYAAELDYKTFSVMIDCFVIPARMRRSTEI
jgi:hypothetical protein